MNTRTALAFLLVMYHLIRGVWLIYVIPPWQGPDEPMHLLLAVSPPGGDQTEKQRIGTERTLIHSMTNNRFWALTGQIEPDPLPIILRTSRPSPPSTMYHRILGFWLRMAGSWRDTDTDSPTEQSLERALLTGRYLSVLLGLGALILFILFSRRVFTGSIAGLLPPFLLIGHSQLAFIGSCLNSDNLLLFLTAMGLACIPLCALQPRHRGAAGLSVAIAIIAPIAKRAGLVLTVTLIPVALIPWIHTRKRILWGGIIVAVLMGAAFAALWTFGMVRSMAKDIGEAIGISGWIGEAPVGWWGHFLSHLWETFWGNFGWVQCPLHPWIYRGLAIVLAGLIFMAPIGFSRRWRGGRIILLLLVNQVILAILQVILALGFRFELGQGRHAFVGLPSLLVLIALGIYGVLPRRIPEWTLIILGTSILICSEMVSWFVMFPCFVR